MKSIFKPGDSKLHRYRVKTVDFAGFESGVVHEVCSTFALGREMEWSSRLFMLEMTDSDEEGIGTMLEIVHEGPAFEGELLDITATIESLASNEIICKIAVETEGRPVARGRTGQKVLKKEKINQIFTRLGN
jgi:predicted thioesterase